MYVSENKKADLTLNTYAWIDNINDYKHGLFFSVFECRIIIQKFGFRYFFPHISKCISHTPMKEYSL